MPERPGRRRRPSGPSIDWLEANGHGEGTVTYKLRDWLFSRQRYWGEPFPIVYDETGLPIGLPESMLPVDAARRWTTISPRTFDPDDADLRARAAARRGSTSGPTSSSTSATARSATGAS